MLGGHLSGEQLSHGGEQLSGEHLSVKINIIFEKLKN